MNFPERLKSLRAEKKVTQVMLAQVTGLTDRTFRKYESGKIEPTLSVLIALADYFDVSLDYLCDRTDDVEKRGEVVYPQFADRLKKLRIDKGIDMELCRPF